MATQETAQVIPARRRSPRVLVVLLAAAATSAAITVAANAGDWDRATLYVVLALALAIFLLVALPIIAPPSRSSIGLDTLLSSKAGAGDRMRHAGRGTAVNEPTASVGGWPVRFDELDTPDMQLTERERELLALVSDGESLESVAEHLDISRDTVDTHLAAIVAKAERLGPARPNLAARLAAARIADLRWEDPVPVVAVEAFEAGGAKLTEREREVLKLVIEGTSLQDVAEHLHISPETVSRHMAAIRRKADELVSDGSITLPEGWGRIADQPARDPRDPHERGRPRLH